MLLIAVDLVCQHEGLALEWWSRWAFIPTHMLWTPAACLLPFSAEVLVVMLRGNKASSRCHVLDQEQSLAVSSLTVDGIWVGVSRPLYGGSRHEDIEKHVFSTKGLFEVKPTTFMLPWIYAFKPDIIDDLARWSDSGWARPSTDTAIPYSRR